MIFNDNWISVSYASRSRARTCYGRRNPSQTKPVPLKRHHSSTFMVGEPAAYATGSPELKAVGPCLCGFELPDHQVVKEHSAGRAARMKEAKP